LANVHIDSVGMTRNGNGPVSQAGNHAVPRHRIVVCIAISDPVLAERMISLLPGDSRFEVHRFDVKGGLDDSGDADVILADRPLAWRRPTIALDDHRHDDGEDLDRWGAEARAILPSTVDGDLLRAAVVMVAAGFSIVEMDGSRGLFEEGEEPARSSDVGHGEMTLTPRENEVLTLLAHGAPNKVIARELGISVHTAKFHVASVLAKLNARNRSDAVAIGIRRGLVML
jgi:DNA-binding CsgD family transcriptional regulator